MAGKSYKAQKCVSTVGDIEDAMSIIEELASEMREGYDNMEGANMGHLPKCEAMGEAADTLENVSTPDIPEALQDIPITYTEWVKRSKREGPSRQVRLDNAVARLTAAKDALESHKDDNEDLDEDIVADLDSLVSELDDIISNVEGVEFPGMFG